VSLRSYGAASVFYYRQAILRDWQPEVLDLRSIKLSVADH
jgi:hypothetical protein